jgi:serine/threonine protein kinase
MVAYKRSIDRKGQTTSSTQVDESIKLAAITREIQVLAHIPLRSHPNIIRLLGNAFEEIQGSQGTSAKISPILIMEFADRGNLEDYLSSETAKSWPYKIREEISKDVAHGMEALHKCKIIWGDCKPANILLFRDESSSGGYRAKINDFGAAILNCHPNSKLHASTRPWNAPNCGSKQGLEELLRTDIYSFGLVVSAIMSNGRQFQNLVHGVKSRSEQLEIIEQRKAGSDGILPVLWEAVRLSLGDSRPSQSPLGSKADIDLVCKVLELALGAKADMSDLLYTFERDMQYETRSISFLLLGNFLFPLDET